MFCQRRISRSFSSRQSTPALSVGTLAENFSQFQQHTDVASSLMEKFVLLLVLLSPAASDVVRVKPGQDATLPCQAGEASIRAAEWSRPDLQPDYILFYRNKRPVPELQNPSFKDRVQLVDRELKDGDVSLILKNVSRNDAGTYECRVAAGGSRRKRALIGTEPISIIQLEVSASGSSGGDVEEGNQIHNNPTEENYRLYYGLVAVLALVCLVVGLAVGWKYKRLTDKNPKQPAADKTVSDLLV